MNLLGIKGQVELKKLVHSGQDKIAEEPPLSALLPCSGRHGQ